MTGDPQPGRAPTPEGIGQEVISAVAILGPLVRNVVASAIEAFKTIERDLDEAYEAAGQPRGPDGKWEWLLDLAAERRGAPARACGRVTDRCDDPDFCSDCPR